MAESQSNNSAESQVHLLATRVAHLEQLVYGPGGPQSVKRSAAPLGTAVAAVGDQLGALAQKHADVKRFCEAFEDIAAFLDSPHLRDAAIPAKAKEEIVMSAETTLRDIAEQLKELDNHTAFLNTNAQQQLPNHSAKVVPLEQVALSARDDLDALSKRTGAVLSSYNEIISLLSRKFLLWDQALSALERRVSASTLAHES